MDDAELVRATRNGDTSAFTAIFDRHAARVHDLALALLRDRIVALEVVEATFLEASQRLHGLEEEHRLAVWLLAVTRRNAALRAGATAGPDRQPSLPNDDPDRVHLAGLVWEAVADLPLRDRTLLDLDLRQSLDGHNLADALGVTINQAQDLQARMRDRIEKGLSGYLIARTDDGRCPELAKVLKGWDGRFAPRESRRIADHVDACTICTQTRFALPSPFALYAAALPAPFPAAVRPRVIERVVLPPAHDGDGAVLPGPPTGPAPAADAAYGEPTAAYQTPFPAPAPASSEVPADPSPIGSPTAAPGPSPWPAPDPAPPPASELHTPDGPADPDHSPAADSPTPEAVAHSDRPPGAMSHASDGMDPEQPGAEPHTPDVTADPDHSTASDSHTPEAAADPDRPPASPSDPTDPSVHPPGDPDRTESRPPLHQELP